MKTRMKQLAIVLLALLFFAACNNAKKDKDVIKIGAVFPLTGTAAELGDYSRNGLLLAVDEINNKGGINNQFLEASIYDSKSEMKEGVSIVNQMFVSDIQPKTLFSQISGIGIAISEVTKRYPIVHFSMSATPTFYTSSPYNVRNYLSSEAISKKAFDFILSNKFKNITIAYMESDYSKPIADSLINYLQNSHIKFKSISFPANQSDNKTLTLKILSNGKSENSLVFLTGYGAILGNIAKELDNQQFLGKLLVEPTFNLPSNLQLLNEIRYSVKLIDIDFDSSNPKTKNQKYFIDNYMKKYGNSPKLSGVLVYETMYLWKYGVEKTRTFNSDTLINFFQSQKILKGNIFDSLVVKNRNIEFPLIIKNLN